VILEQFDLSREDLFPVPSLQASSDGFCQLRLADVAIVNAAFDDHDLAVEVTSAARKPNSFCASARLAAVLLIEQALPEECLINFGSASAQSSLNEALVPGTTCSIRSTAARVAPSAKGIRLDGRRHFDGG